MRALAYLAVSLTMARGPVNGTPMLSAPNDQPQAVLGSAFVAPSVQLPQIQSKSLEVGLDRNIWSKAKPSFRIRISCGLFQAMA